MYNALAQNYTTINSKPCESARSVTQRQCCTTVQLRLTTVHARLAWWCPFDLPVPVSKVRRLLTTLTVSPDMEQLDDDWWLLRRVVSHVDYTWVTSVAHTTCPCPATRRSQQSALIPSLLLRCYCCAKCEYCKVVYDASAISNRRWRY